jgi:hypothetical protein
MLSQTMGVTGEIHPRWRLAIMAACLFLMSFGLGAPPAVDWKQVIQKPHADLPVPDLGLRPILLTRDGKPITKKADWDQARQELHKTWLAQLGTAPDKPRSLTSASRKPRSWTATPGSLLASSAKGTTASLPTC